MGCPVRDRRKGGAEASASSLTCPLFTCGNTQVTRDGHADVAAGVPTCGFVSRVGVQGLVYWFHLWPLAPNSVRTRPWVRRLSGGEVNTSSTRPYNPGGRVL